MGSPDTPEATGGAKQVRFRLLGPVEVVVDDRPVPLGGEGIRGVLAMLLLEPNQVVPVDRIVDVLWAHEPPESARTMVQGYVSRLRHRLSAADPAGSVRILTHPPGYQLLVDESQIDVTLARRLVIQARGAPAARRAELLRTAQSLWRGLELADVGGRVPAPELAELRLAVLEGRISADLELGRHHEVVGELTQLVEEHPFRERLVAQLMLALYRSGRRTAALGAYQRFAHLVAGHSGMDPGPQLRALHSRVLLDDAALLNPQAEPILTPRVGVIVPAQLPAAPSGFTGRDHEIAWLDQLLSMDNSAGALGVIAGPPGVGKTALALRWANRVTGTFPDGQLFAGLCGFDPHHRPLSPADVLARFLLALGVRPDDVPPEIDQRAALYRSLLAQRRVLVVLDDARDSQQVRPLLPAGSSSLVLITSRVRLDGLVAGLAARLLPLDTLAPQTAAELIEKIAGPAEPAERALRSRLAELCGYLPLALRIASARLAAGPSWSASNLVEELADERTRLGALDVEGEDTSVRAALDVSYRALSPPLAATFRLIGMFPGPWLGPPTVAALCSTTVPDALRHLRSLAARFLVTETSQDMFVMHDLVRVYAREVARTELSGVDQDAALHRLLRHYLVAADWARRWLNPVAADAQDGEGSSPFQSGGAQPALESVQQAVDWLEREWPNLVALAEASAELGEHDELVRLARIISDLSAGARGLSGPTWWWSAGVAVRSGV
jgi:DNA-binding SARP family transcriptional activator